MSKGRQPASQFCSPESCFDFSNPHLIRIVLGFYAAGLQKILRIIFMRSIREGNKLLSGLNPDTSVLPWNPVQHATTVKNKINETCFSLPSLWDASKYQNCWNIRWALEPVLAAGFGDLRLETKDGSQLAKAGHQISSNCPILQCQYCSNTDLYTSCNTDFNESEAQRAELYVLSRGTITKSLQNVHLQQGHAGLL